MKKEIWIILIVVIVLVISVIVMFNSRGKNITIDIETLANEILQNIEFEDEINKVDIGTVEKLYNINNAVSQIVYMSSGSTAEEIAIFEFENKEDCQMAVEKANKRIEEQKQSFRDYMPKEMKKLEDSIVESENNYLIVCITDNQGKIEEILDKYIK